ncbi:heat shock protein HscA [Buchnera aphidicola (Cinara tujafilina)]|uniref:Heat shock protein HscA n=1 Tax=Buchnera aphidicola (Cinara tujafilina) TaxID=261317 RepID=F7WZT0_9GAMM|nr:Hsp70 family protein [Buchnera aphidicola]AEH39956.1 heat shock protein HscA [Buchnera aphidicola (Cinara tujafilina)]
MLNKKKILCYWDRFWNILLFNIIYKKIKNYLLYLIKKNRKYFPSIVSFQNQSIQVGWHAKKKMFQDPINIISSIKRFIGLSKDNIYKKYPMLPYLIKENDKNQIIFTTKFGKINISFIIKTILKYLLKKAKKFNKILIKGAVITVPAYFNSIQKNEIRKAAHEINLKVLRLLNEPTAAAIAYGLEKKQKGIFCVYDLGGGTFDVSILKISKGVFEVLATNGHSSLGGDDFDILIANFISKKINNVCKLTEIEYKNLLIKSEKIKITLSTTEKTEIIFLNQKIILTRKNFNILIYSLVQKTIKILQSALLDANINVKNISEIILVGGSTYIPLIQNTLEKFFSKKPLSSINPSEVVVRGAGLHAYFLNAQKKYDNRNPILLLDVLPISIGIELMGGFMEKMILKNTTLPIEVSKIFTNFKKTKQDFVLIFFREKKKYVKDCQLLTQFKIKDLPKKNAGEIKIVITFQIDVDGLLSILVRNDKLNIQKNIKIDSIYSNKNITTVNFEK